MGELRVGDQVTVSSLQSAVDLNGACGKLVDFKEQASRWAVQLSSGQPKLIRSANLMQDVGIAGKQNKLLEHARSPVSYEDPQHWASSSSCMLPIEQSGTNLRYQANGGVVLMNGEMQEVNKVRTNVHGAKVHVIKVQYTPTAPGFGWKFSSISVYDMLRNVILMIEDAETGARKEAYHRLVPLAQARGGDVGLSKKVYLFAQRRGASLRVFLGRLPVQSQPF